MNYKIGDEILITTFKRGVAIGVYKNDLIPTGWAIYCGTWQKIRSITADTIHSHVEYLLEGIGWVWRANEFDEVEMLKQKLELLDDE